MAKAVGCNRLRARYGQSAVIPPEIYASQISDRVQFSFSDLDRIQFDFSSDQSRQRVRTASTAGDASTGPGPGRAPASRSSFATPA
jgi:hypothetical protein